MRSVSILSIASLMALAAAQPAAVTVTEVKTVVTTIDVTKTVYAGDATEVPHQPPVHQPPVHHSHHHSHPDNPATPIIPETTFEQAQPTRHHTRPHTHKHTHTRPPPPPPSSTYSPPPPPPTSTASPPSGGVPADALSGEGTFYSPGLGSCGITNSASDSIVALSLTKMANGPNPNTNPKCGQKIHLVYKGVHQTAIVTDSCYACAENDVDMTPTLFQGFADESVGRLTGVEWWFDDPSFM